MHAKNDFSFAIVSGNLFDQDDETVAKLIDGGITVPVTTYFTVGTSPLPQSVISKLLSDDEVCENLHYLGKRSVHKTSDGIRIVTLGGVLDPTIIGGQSKEQHLPFHTLDDAKALRGANSTDILLTTVWPANVWNGSNVDIPVDPSSIRNGDSISDLVVALRPRYHFSPSTGDFAYEREPFYHPQTDSDQPTIDLTRFISLAPLGNSAKAKAMYAFSLTKDAVTSPPVGSTITPYVQTGTKKRRADFDGGYRFSRGHDDQHHRRRRRERSPPPGPDRCFFCLSNPNLPTHMVCSIGEDAYLATAKGPLTLATTFETQGLKFPGHVIIVPFTHAPSISVAAMAESAASTFKEMSRFRESLQGMVSAKTKRRLGGVTWEINRSRNIHTHWQFLPVPANMVKRGLVEAAFRVEAENLKLPKLEAKDFGTSDDVEGDYFRVWIWAETEDGDDGEPDTDGGRIISKNLVMRFDESVRFDLQYGRKVMSKLLGLDGRAIWQDCVQDEKEETADVATFREAFKEWDFTLTS